MDYFFRRSVRGASARRVRSVEGSGIAVDDVCVKLFLIANRSCRFTMPSWFASPLMLLVPKYCFVSSRSERFIRPSSVCVT